jgi:calcineurin-like phosphoesterase family protein
MNKLFFTSDLHLGHKNIIALSHRPYSSVDEMDKDIIDKWNYVIDKDDVVFILGDFCFGDPQKYLNKLAGTIVFLKGDHDKWMRGCNYPHLRIIEPDGLLDEYGSQRSIILCHWSMRSWYQSHYGSWHLFGHHHNKLEPWGLSFDIGVDCWNYFPVSMEQVKEKMATLTPIVDFRNGGTIN